MKTGSWLTNKRSLPLIFLLVVTIHSSWTQAQVGISTTNSVPDNSAILDIDAANRGLLIPRVALTSSTDVATIPNPATSLQIYNTGTGGLSPAGFYFWNGSQWQQIGGQSSVSCSVSYAENVTSSASVANSTVSSNTIAYTKAANISCNITVNKISFEVSGVTNSGTVKVGVYSADGQTKLIDATSPNISAPGTVTVPVSSVSLSAGMYYFVMVPVGSTSLTILGSYCNSCPLPSGEPVLISDQTVSPGSLPNSFNPLTLPANEIYLIGYRLDD